MGARKTGKQTQRESDVRQQHKETAASGSACESGSLPQAAD